MPLFLLPTDAGWINPATTVAPPSPTGGPEADLANINIASSGFGNRLAQHLGMLHTCCMGPWAFHSVMTDERRPSSVQKDPDPTDRAYA
jgi:hypothetical protein